jgi:hypothetical protein
MGVASIGEADVDLQRATELLQQAGEILDWVEGLLPETSRRPRYEVVTNYEQTTMFVVEPLDQSDTGANPEGE